MGEFGYWQSVLKLPKNVVLFYETYFEENNMNRKPFILIQNRITTKFDQKKGEFGFG